MTGDRVCIVNWCVVCHRYLLNSEFLVAIYAFIKSSILDWREFKLASLAASSAATDFFHCLNLTSSTAFSKYMASNLAKLLLDASPEYESKASFAAALYGIDTSIFGSSSSSSTALDWASPSCLVAKIPATAATAAAPPAMMVSETDCWCLKVENDREKFQ